MVGQTRIVLFPWTGNATAFTKTSPPHLPAVSTCQLSRGRYDASRLVVDGFVGWRMIGGNNRELGRGARPLGNTVEVHQAIHQAQLAFASPEVRMRFNPGTGWSWQISLTGERVAVSSRGYQRQRECEYSLEKFRLHFPTAKVVMPTTSTSRAARNSLLTIPNVLGDGGPSIVVAGPTFEGTM